MPPHTVGDSRTEGRRPGGEGDPIGLGKSPAAETAGKNHKGLCGPVPNKNNKARINGLLGAQGTMSNRDSQ